MIVSALLYTASPSSVSFAVIEEIDGPARSPQSPARTVEVPTESREVAAAFLMPLVPVNVI